MIEPSQIERMVSAEGWESLLVVLVIMVLSGLANLIKKLQGQPRETSWEDESQPSPSRPQQSWEEELRRMLEEKPKPASPPLLAPTTYKPAPLRPPAPIIREEEGPSSPALAHLTQSATALERASMLHERVMSHFHQVDERTELHRPAVPVAHAQKRTAEADAAVALLRKPASTRRAIIASIILGPPKALEA